MSDPVVTTPPEPTPTPAPTPTPSLMDDIRQRVAGEEDEGAAVTATPSPTPPSDAEGAVPPVVPGLTPEQIEAAKNDPQVVEAILAGQMGTQTIETLFKEMLAENQRTSETKAEEAKRAATIEEALKKGQENDDWGDFGKLVATNLANQREQNTVHQAAMGEVLGNLDTAVEAVYGPALDALTDEEVAGMARQNFRTDGEFMTHILSTLANKQAEMVRSEAANEATTSTVATAAATAEAARKAREAVGVGALPGGTGDQVDDKGRPIASTGFGDNISALLREGLRDAFADAEE